MHYERLELLAFQRQLEKKNRYMESAIRYLTRKLENAEVTNGGKELLFQRNLFSISISRFIKRTSGTGGGQGRKHRQETKRTWYLGIIYHSTCNNLFR